MEAKDTAFYHKKTLNIRGTLMNLAQPKVMGIINSTPDSFYDGGKNATLPAALNQISEMLSAGADIIDVGGHSTKPNAVTVDAETEKQRVLPLIEAAVKEFPQIVVSVDTFRSTIAKQAIEAGASIINDVSGGDLDIEMFDTVAQLKVPYILMHMRGTPSTMQKMTKYEHLINDITLELSRKIYRLRDLSVNDIIVDPGLGFAKSIDQNYEILKNLAYFDCLDCPIMIGLSRKSMIFKTLDVNVSDSLNGTTALNMVALMNGANILRVHDVQEAVETVKLFNKLQN